MKKIVSMLLLSMLLAGSAIAGEQDFTIVNNTGMEIARMYITPSSLTDWGADVLSATPITAGGERDVLVLRNEDVEVWDLLVLSPDGTPVKWPGLRLNDFSKISLTIENGRPVAYFE